MRISAARRLLLASPILLYLAESAFGQQIAIELDPARTVIKFVLGDVLHTVHGTFRMKTGRIELDTASKSISGSIVVDAASGESGSSARDKRMKRDILETQRFPEITFTPTRIEGSALSKPTSQATVSGWFEIHGERHQISIPVEIGMSGPLAKASGHFVVPYVAWGMKNPSTFILRVNDKVEIDVVAVGRIEPER